MDMQINGLTDVVSDLEKAISIYPDAAEDALRLMGNDFKRKVVKQYKEQTNQYSGKLVKGMKVSKVQGYGSNMYVEFSGTAPHFHLLENGHEIVARNGEKVGFKPGLEIVKNTAAGYGPTAEERVNKMVTKVLKGSGL